MAYIPTNSGSMKLLKPFLACSIATTDLALALWMFLAIFRLRHVRCRLMSEPPHPLTVLPLPGIMYTALEDTISGAREARLETGRKLRTLFPQIDTTRSGFLRARPGSIKFARVAATQQNPTIRESHLLWYTRLSHLDQRTWSSILLKTVSAHGGILPMELTIYSCTKSSLTTSMVAVYSYCPEESRATLSRSVVCRQATDTSSQLVRGRI